MGILYETDTLYCFKYMLILSHPKSIQLIWNLTLIRAAGEPRCLKAKGTEQILDTKLLKYLFNIKCELVSLYKGGKCHGGKPALKDPAYCNNYIWVWS